MQQNLYIYLTRRDKQAVKVITILGLNQAIPATRISNISSLGLSRELEAKISKIIYEDRMLWEPWMETSSSYIELKQVLEARGYRGVPANPSAVFKFSINDMAHNIKGSNVVRHSTRMLSNRIPQRKTMLR